MQIGGQIGEDQKASCGGGAGARETVALIAKNAAIGANRGDGTGVQGRMLAAEGEKASIEREDGAGL